MNYEALNWKSIRRGFMDFDKENPQIYATFEQQCMRAIAMGKSKISAKLIINVIRWEIYLDSSDENFKINDAFQAYYARKFAELHPEHSGIFNFRKLRNEKTPPYMSVDQNGQLSFL